MKRIYNKTALYLFISLFLLLFYQQAAAQCNNLTLNLIKTNSTCLANGKIKVTVSGADAGNIRQSDMQFQVSGDKDIAFSPYADNTILNLSAGTYTITLKAFCNVSNDWIVASSTATTTITSSYKEMNFTFSRVIPTLNCRPTGIARLVIESGTGTPPFNVEMTSCPGGYTGPKTFTISSRIDSIKNLAAGNYTFKVTDDCGYSISDRSITVGTMPQDFYNVFHQYLQSTRTANACDLVQTYALYPSSGTDPDGNFYHYTNPQDFFEVAFLYNDTGTKNWQPLARYNTMNLTIPSPYTMKSMRASGAYFMAYIRVKGCTAEHKIKLSLSNPTSYLAQSVSGCDTISLNFYSYSNYNTAICYPYEWRVVNASTGTPIPGFDWQGSVTSAQSVQVAYNVPISQLKMEYRDAEGTTWERAITTSLPKPSMSTASSYSYTQKEPDGVYRTYVYANFYPSVFPVGTTFKYLSGPTPLVNPTGTMTVASSYIYLYSAPPYSTVYSTDYARLDPGLYRFEITKPGCAPDTIQGNPTIYKLQSPPVYEIVEECDGLLVTFKSGGQMEYSYWNAGTNSVVTYTTGTPHIRIGSGPSGDLTKVVPHGGSLKLPLAGRYYIHLLTSSSSSSTVVNRDTIDYNPTPFTLDDAVTSAYLCQGEATGFIRVKGAGGTGNYKYELYDNGVLKFTNTTGVFNYGVGGGTYKVILYDTQCGYSYPQDVTLVDLGIAQIAYSNSPDNKFCASDSIYLKCLTLGETTYTWAGPGIDITNPASPSYKNKQNPVIAASDVGVGTHVYTITVTPESCGTEMTQTVTLLIEDCEGARDDYKTMLINTTDSVDILANDGFPSSCAASVTPVITISPTKGTATIVNKKVIYTPIVDFVGKDSLTYRTVCSGTVTTAKVYFTVLEFPDNIVDADCYVNPPSTTWSIKEVALNKNVLIQNYGPLMIGDIDGDGIVEIIGYKEDTRSSNNYESGGIKIFYYNSVTNQIELKNEFLFVTTGGSSSATFGSMAISRYNNTGYIVVAGTDKYLYAYSPTGARLWKSDVQYHSPHTGTILGIADFSNDGIPEVFTGNQIFSLSTGKMLCDGGTTNSSGLLGTAAGHSTVAADMDGDGILELVAGVNIYKVTITNQNGTANNSITLLSGMQLTETLPTNAAKDGATQVVDIDNDGALEVVVLSLSSGRVVAYVWKPLPNNQSYTMGSYLVPATGIGYYSVPMLGNIDSSVYPEIVFITNGSAYNMYALKFDPAAAVGSQISLKWSLIHTDGSGCTGATLFDFDQDGRNEIVYRDQTDLRIIDGSNNPGANPNEIRATFNNVKSGTLREYPVIADIDGDGQAEIVVTGGDGIANTVNGISVGNQNGYVRVFKTNGSAWAPARKVWNQYGYNAVYVYEDLTIPRYSISPVTAFAGPDGLLGTSDDVRPYNNFLQQQTMLSKSGTLLWLTPDVYPVPSLTNSVVIGDSVSITVGMVNQGDAAIGSPVYVSLYKETLAAINRFVTDSAHVQINPGDTGYVTVRIPNIHTHLPILNIIIRVNDDGMDFTNFTHQPECDETNNVMTIRNPALNLMMKKEATLLVASPIPHNGTYPNPVSVLHNEDIEYTITAVNANHSVGKVIIRDTLPAYLQYQSSSPTVVPTTVSGNPSRIALEWTINGVASMATTSVKVVATPEAGCVSSQPMFINGAWVLVSDTIYVPTNYTYHQGACIGVATFSAGLGGTIYNADEQALDYKTSPRTGILIVPDEGYRFAGWSHDDYISLRGETIQAQSQITHYDTLTIYGNVNLHANFEPEEYPVRYHLNGGKPVTGNPLSYTVKSGPIILDAPKKPGDEFMGWTGSNGEVPQHRVVIPEGSMGELAFYANYLYSGREDETSVIGREEEKIWAAESELYIKTSKIGSIVRIYSVEGILQHQHTIVHVGEMILKLPRGIYIVTLDNQSGQKVKID